MSRYFPVSDSDIAYAAKREGTTIAIRSEHTFGDETYIILSYGHPDPYMYVQHEGKTYGVFRYEKDEDRTFEKE